MVEEMRRIYRRIGRAALPRSVQSWGGLDGFAEIDVVRSMVVFPTGESERPAEAGLSESVIWFV